MAIQVSGTTVIDNSRNITNAGTYNGYTPASAARTITAGSGLTGGGTLAADFSISHADTSSQGSVSNSGNTALQSITLDGYGHVTGISSVTISVPSVNYASGNAGLPTGGIGTYAFLAVPLSKNQIINPGDTRTGGGVYWASASSDRGAVVGYGTWRALGYGRGDVESTSYEHLLWLRIA